MSRLAVIPRTVLTLVSGVLATVLCGTMLLIVTRWRYDPKLIDRIVGAWASAWLSPAGAKVEVTGRENVDPDSSYVVVANHLSNFDVMVCFKALPLPIRYLAKKELFSIPILAPAMRSIGIVEVDRQARGAAIESVNIQSARVIERGDSLIIYPEGTRSRDGKIKTFKKGAFTMAVGAAMPILPVTIHGTWEMWRPGGKTIRPGRVRVIIDPPIPTAGLDREETEALRHQVSDLIGRRFTELSQSYTPAR